MKREERGNRNRKRLVGISKGYRMGYENIHSR